MAMPPPPPPFPATPGPVTMENGRFEDEEKPPSSEFIVFMNITNTVTHLCLGAVAFIAIFFANSLYINNALTNHIYLCTTGYIILMSQAVLSLNPHTGWAHNFKYPTKRAIHWVMQIVGSILAISGSVIRIIDLENSFQSTHGTLGIVALIFTILSLIGGVVNLFVNNIKINPMIIKVLHSCFGSMTIVVAYLALIFAFKDGLFSMIYGDSNANLCVALSVIALIGTLLSPWITIFKRIFN